MNQLFRQLCGLTFLIFIFGIPDPTNAQPNPKLVCQKEGNVFRVDRIKLLHSLLQPLQNGSLDIYARDPITHTILNTRDPIDGTYSKNQKDGTIEYNELRLVALQQDIGCNLKEDSCKAEIRKRNKVFTQASFMFLPGNIKPKKYKFFTTIRREKGVSVSEKQSDTMLNISRINDKAISTAIKNFRDFLSPVQPPLVIVECRHPELIPENATSSDGETVASRTPSSSSASSEFDLGNEILRRFKVRGKISELGIKRSRSAEFKTVKPADFSITIDEKRDKVEYQNDAVFGLELYNGWKSENEFLKLIPYLRYQRRITAGNITETTNQEIDNLSFGGQIEWRFLSKSLKNSFRPLTWFRTNQLSIAPQFTTDSEAETQVGAFNLTWRPLPLIELGTWDPFMHYHELGPIKYKFNALFKMNSGAVFDDGGNTDLNQTDEFLRIGGQISAKLLVDQSIEWFKGFSAEISYLLMAGPIGQVDEIERFEAALTYTFPQQSLFSVQGKYQNGRVDDTLADVEFWTISLGVKY